MSNIATLLHEVHFKLSTNKAARNKFAKELAPDFRIFDYLRNDELGISRCIADLLNPVGTHAQGAVFLTEFLKLIGYDTPWHMDCRKNSVEVEKQIEKQRRIDIFIELANIVIGIENKPWAGDQENQLSDYASFLKKTAGNKKWMLIYLCNWEPSSYSMVENERVAMEESGNFLTLNFSQLAEWLDSCVSKTKVLAVRVFIDELGKFVRTRINGEEEMSDQIEIQQAILASEATLASALHIAKEITVIKGQLLDDLLVQLTRKLEPDGMGLIPNLGNWRAYNGFFVEFWPNQKILLRFDFNKTNLNGFAWGLRRNNEEYHSPKTWDEILALMNTQFKNGLAYPWWPWYSDLPDDYFGAELKDWSVSEEPWLMIKNGELAADIVKLALLVRNVFVGKEHLLK
jgi:PD-(D/E)XK nuclease superfamily